MKIYLTADVGSTFTKLTAIDIKEQKIIGSAKAFTTISTNVMEGFNNANLELKSLYGVEKFDKIIASSSAAGGLKMIAVGLVPDLTVKAARQAASNAGAKILKTYAYELGNQEMQEIESMSPDIILLSGGIDGGNKNVILHNAEILAEMKINFSIVVAGNKSANDEIENIFKAKGKNPVICANVMPQFNQLNIEPAKKAIRDLFIKNIISAKGLDNLQKILDVEIIPTPLAVFNAALLLSTGTSSIAGAGDLMIYDVGGATTDVYSMAEGLPEKPNIFLHGLKDPFAKRTVEGDLGMRYSIRSLAEEATISRLSEILQMKEEEICDWIEKCEASPDLLPGENIQYKQIDDALAGEAIRISAIRHCGSIESVFTTMGQAYAQNGKDLSGVKKVIGTGGSLIQGANAAEILKNAIYKASDMNLLKPIAPELFLDKKYILSSMGLLAQYEPETALSIMKKEILNNGQLT